MNKKTTFITVGSILAILMLSAFYLNNTHIIERLRPDTKKVRAMEVKRDDNNRLYIYDSTIHIKYVDSAYEIEDVFGEMEDGQMTYYKIVE